MALPATDSFTAANGTILTTYSANWRTNSGQFKINTNAIHPDSASGEIGASWTADVFSNDQYSQGVIVALAGAGGIGVACRCNTSGTANYYGYYGNTAGNSGELHKTVAGAFTILGSARAGFAVNDVLRIEAEGTTIRAIRNSVLQGTTQTDSTFASGAAGLCGYTQTTTNRIDDWEGGNLGGAASTSSVFFRSPMRFMLVR